VVNVVRSSIPPDLRTVRPVCARCRRPVSVCYCAALTTLETVTRVVILQHPRESGMPIGTARMATLCLPQASLHVGMRWGDHPAFRAAVSDPARPAVLLYPGPDARDVLRDPPPGPVTLIVVDGTWSQTRSIVKHDPALAALPRYAFTAPEPSVYRVRKEPCDEYVSTIEALMHVLGALEGDPAKFRALLGPFRAMVDAHLAAQARCPRARVYHPRPPRPGAPRVPDEIIDRFDDLVCVAGEASVWPKDAPESAAAPAGGGPDELVQWFARRPSTGETFDVVAAPTRPLAPSTHWRTGLDAARLGAGGSRDALFAAYAQFARPRDVVCAWGPYAPNLFEENGGTLSQQGVDLRVAARRLEGRGVGAIEAYATSIAGAQPAPVGTRAAARVEMMTRIIAAWRARASG
jgi:DTW domain-containing protein